MRIRDERSSRPSPRYRQSARDSAGSDGSSTPYRQGGWTVRRWLTATSTPTCLKLALTERADHRTIRRRSLGELPDARTAPIAPSLALLEALHWRWCVPAHPWRGFERRCAIRTAGMTVDRLMAPTPGTPSRGPRDGARDASRLALRAASASRSKRARATLSAPSAAVGRPGRAAPADASPSCRRRTPAA
jgi:hypothetical protein